MDGALIALLAAIRQYEGGPGAKGYGTVYGGSPVKADVSKMTLDQVLEFQGEMKRAKSRSTACGGYQFIRDTLLATIRQMKLTGEETWTPELQDRMAVHLMEGRGLSRFMAGTIGPDTFANNLAMEWASLPVVTRIKGAHRIVQPGETYFADDGLNKAHHDPAVILALVRALKTGAVVTVPPAPPPDVPKPEPAEPQKPRGLLAALIDLIIAIFTRRQS